MQGRGESPNRQDVERGGVWTIGTGLGNERFTSGPLTRINNLTSGQIYTSVLEKERRGDYLGKNVQVIPIVTDDIKSRIRESAASGQAAVLFTGMGGSPRDL